MKQLLDRPVSVLNTVEHAGVKVDELLPSIKKVLDPKNLSHTDLVNTPLPKDSLAHYGVLGMKWGVRNDRQGNSVRMATTSDVFDLDKPVTMRGSGDVSKRQGAKNQRDLAKITKKVHTELLKGDRVENVIAKVNSEFQSADLSKKKQLDDYYLSVSEKLTKIANDYTPQGLTSFVGVRASNGDTKSTLVVGTPDIIAQLKHSESSPEVYKVFLDVDVDATGMILGLSLSKNQPKDPTILEHSDNIAGEFLAHYGVLGMKWGVRKDRSSNRKSKASKIDTLKERRTNKVLEKGRRSNTFSDNRQNRRMSDQELTKLINRLSLEQRLGQLTHVPAPPESRWKKLGKDIAFDVTRGAATEVGKLILAQALKVEFNKRASVPYQIPVKEIKKAIDNVT